MIAEKRELKCDKNIYLTLVEEDCAQCRKEGDHYLLEVGGAFSTRQTLKHELYHICDGHTENHSLLKYLLLDEPQAEIYAATGLKL
ncbi:MAG: hypothetical protein ABIB71_01600 [Candidatus Woesearchaeota archaeon]